jgi:hypothetical protein
MADGQYITDYLAADDAAPSSAPSLAASGQWGMFQDATNGDLYKWNLNTNAWDAITGGGGSLTTANATLGADVVIAARQTWYEVLTLTLGDGTWLVFVTLDYWGNGVQGTSYTIDLWDGSSVHYASANDGMGWYLAQNTLVALITLTGSTDLHLRFRAESIDGGHVLAAGSDFAEGNNCTQINAIRIA